jgi:site-specific recombinase XerD
LIGSVSHIVSAGLSRANVINPPTRGANLLRHSAATAMLRSGCALETVSGVLRHRSLEMTSYYAKIDVQMLMEIAQPWPEGAPC